MNAVKRNQFKISKTNIKIYCLAFEDALAILTGDIHGDLVKF